MEHDRPSNGAQRKVVVPVAEDYLQIQAEQLEAENEAMAKRYPSYWREKMRRQERDQRLSDEAD